MQGPSCVLAPLLESVGLAVAEVAEDETTNLNGLLSWMDGRDEPADSRLRIHVGAAAESWHSAGDRRRWTVSSVRPTTSRFVGKARPRMCTNDQQSYHARLRRGPSNHERREGFLNFLERERDVTNCT